MNFLKNCSVVSVLSIFKHKATTSNKFIFNNKATNYRIRFGHSLRSAHERFDSPLELRKRNRSNLSSWDAEKKMVTRGSGPLMHTRAITILRGRNFQTRNFTEHLRQPRERESHETPKGTVVLRFSVHLGILFRNYCPLSLSLSLSLSLQPTTLVSVDVYNREPMHGQC